MNKDWIINWRCVCNAIHVIFVLSSKGMILCTFYDKIYYKPSIIFETLTWFFATKNQSEIFASCVCRIIKEVGAFKTPPPPKRHLLSFFREGVMSGVDQKKPLVCKDDEYAVNAYVRWIVDIYWVILGKVDFSHSIERNVIDPLQMLWPTFLHFSLKKVHMTFLTQLIYVKKINDSRYRF